LTLSKPPVLAIQLELVVKNPPANAGDIRDVGQLKTDEMSSRREGNGR